MKFFAKRLKKQEQTLLYLSRDGNVEMVFVALACLLQVTELFFFTMYYLKKLRKRGAAGTLSINFVGHSETTAHYKCQS